MDVLNDYRRRYPHYADDWKTGGSYGLRILAPATYIFFASVLPAVSFGEQLAQNTDGALTVVQVLVATAISGLLQSFVGGQPLLINGVAQPIVTIYTFMYAFVKGRPDFDIDLFLPWAAWVCVWCATLLVLMAMFGACRLVHRFTRMAGEIFGMLIAVLFLQQAVRGLISEFRPEPSYRRNASLVQNAGVDPSKPLINPTAPDPGHTFREEDEPWWILINGLWGLFLASGFILTAVLVTTARSWRFGTSIIRGILADYGVPLLVVAWTALSYALQSGGKPVPSGIPRRVSSPLTWQVKDSWATVTRMGDVPGPYIAVALIPGAIISVLFWFDHGVSSKLGQQKELNLQKPPTYAWDQCLLSVFLLAAGFLGLPPPNGVLPQSPLHTRVCCTLRMTADAARQAKAKKQRGDHLRPDISSDRQKKRAGRASSPHALVEDPFQGNGIKEGEVNGGQSEGGARNLRGQIALGYMNDKEVDPQSPVHSSEGEGSDPMGRPGTAAKRRVIEVAQGNGGRDVVEQRHNSKEEVEVAQGNGAQGVVERQQQQRRQQQQQQQQQQQEEGSSEGSASCCRQAQMEPEGFGKGYPNLGPKPSDAYASVEPGYSENGEEGAHSIKCPGLVRRSVQLPIPHDLLAQIPSDMRHLLVNHRHYDDHHGAKAGTPDDIVHDPTAAARIRSRQEPGAPPAGDFEEGAALELRVAEQRLTNLIQSLCVVASLAAVHVLQLIPTAVVWAYFAYMAIESFPGSQLWNRMLMMLTDPKRRALVLEDVHAAYMESVPFRVVAAFTAFEFVYLAGVWALVTWAGIGGIAFPAPIIALIPIRSYLLPRMFKPEHLAELDADEYDIVEGIPPEQAVQETGQAPFDIRDIVEGQYTGTQVVHRISHEALRRRSHTLAPEASLARATAPAQYHQGSDNV